MGDWDGSGDQYKVDTESRYPMFSDMQTNDYSIVAAPKMPPVRKVSSFEAQYLSEQQNIPTYFKCKCGECAAPAYRSQPMDIMRKQTIDDRLKKYQEERTAMFKQPQKEPVSSITITPSDINGTMILIMFMFLILIFVCVFYTRAINKLQTQIKSLKQLIKK